MSNIKAYVKNYCLVTRYMLYTAPYFQICAGAEQTPVQRRIRNTDGPIIDIYRALISRTAWIFTVRLSRKGCRRHCGLLCACSAILKWTVVRLRSKVKLNCSAPALQSWSCTEVRLRSKVELNCGAPAPQSGRGL